jgi:hypothetical protein
MRFASGAQGVRKIICPASSYSAWFFRLACVLLLVAPSLPGQTSLSTVRGTAKDQSGAIVPAVQITIVDLERGLQRSLVTNENGEFEIPDLARGTYRMTAMAPGFSVFVADGIGLESGQIRRVDVVLNVGEVTTQVNVREGLAVIATEGSKIATGFNNRRLEEAPIHGDGRNAILILTTMPFIQSYSLYELRIAGQTSAQMQSATDGHTADGRSGGVNMLDIQEAQAVPVNNSAEHSRVGYLNFVPKSGTNQWHGQFTYWHYNSSLSTRDTFSPRKTVQKDHTINAGIGGPIIRDRTFFYFSWNEQRFPAGSFHLRTVPTAAQRAGDFSQLIGLNRIIRDPTTGAPFPNNTIPTSRLNPVALKVNEKYLPAPNRGDLQALSNNFEWFHPYPLDAISTSSRTLRIDHKISEKNNVNVRTNVPTPGEKGTYYILARNYPALAATRNRGIRPLSSIVINDTHVFAPTLVNSFRFGFRGAAHADGRTVLDFTPVDGGDAVRELGLQGVNATDIRGQGFPTMSIAGYTDLALSGGGDPVSDNSNIGVYDSVTWSRGRHTLKFGGEFKPFSDYGGTIPAGTFGSFSFDGTYTGHAYADFLLGIPRSSSRINNPLIYRKRKDNETGFFITDTFKVTSRLTLDLGLRWERFGSPFFEDGLMYNWDPATGNVIVANDALQSVSRLYPTNLITVVGGDVRQKPSLRNLRPRLGAAYRISNKTVIRGGYGAFTLTNGLFDGLLTSGPFQLSETFFNEIRNGAPLFQMPNPFPPGSGTVAAQSISGFPLQVENGTLHQFNITVERQIGETGFRLSYAGSRSVGVNYNVNINKPPASLIPFTASRRPYPQFVNTTWERRDGRQNYNALNFQVLRKVGSVIFDNHWTWTSNLQNTNLEDAHAPLRWSRIDNYSTHRVVANVTWQVPVGRGKRFLTNSRGLLDHVLGGWSLNWVALMETGFHFSPTFSGSDPSNTNTNGGRPDRIRDGNLPVDERTLGRWFDPSAFAPPPRGRFGNSGPNVLEGPGFNHHGLTMMKTFRLGERLSWMIGMAMDNFLNHPNYGMPNANISSTAAGVISSTRADDYASRRKGIIRTRLEF